MRIVSLVPSLTETLFALGLGPEEVVGRTAWCVHPAPAVAGVPVVGGTKTPSLRSIRRLSPDLVLLEREENRRETHVSLERAAIPTWVAHVTATDHVAPMLEELGARVGRGLVGARLAGDLREALASIAGASARGPRVVPLIWHEPLMALTVARYGGDLLARCGFLLPDPGGEGAYPRVTPEGLASLDLDVLLLSSEPHAFTQAEGEEIAGAMVAAGARRPLALKVDGEALTWFGARTAAAVRVWCDLRRRLLESGACQHGSTT
jgi:ABC-type Fe3+-hydroxamate transport system substrate-binding protein